MLKKNVTKEKLKAGRVAIGVRMAFASPYVVEVLGNAGFDFVYFDLEHALISEESCEQMIRAAELVGLTPLVRVRANELGVALRLLDSGAMGVIVSNCTTKQEAEAAVEAVKYAPDGKRGIGGRSLLLKQFYPSHWEEWPVVQVPSSRQLHGNGSQPDQSLVILFALKIL